MKHNQKYVKVRLAYCDEQVYLSNLDTAINNSSLDRLEKRIFSLMFNTFGLLQKIQNDYFRVCEYTDGKYTLNVRKDLNDIVTVLFSVRPDYHGMRDKFQI